jgi:hypothetical protein
LAATLRGCPSLVCSNACVAFDAPQPITFAFYSCSSRVPPVPTSSLNHG